MDPHLLRLKLLVLVALSVAVCFGWFVLQRLWYAQRTARMPSVETVWPKLFPEGLLAVLALAFGWFGVAGLVVLPDLTAFSGVDQPHVLCEIESGDGLGMQSWVIYDSIDAEAPQAARRRGAIAGVDGGLTIEYVRVSWGPVPLLVGQPDLVKVTRIYRSTGDAESVPNDRALVLSSGISSHWALWPFLRSVETSHVSRALAKEGHLARVAVENGNVVVVEARR